MLRRIQSWLRRRFESDDEHDEREGTAFSLLDASVQYAHGGNDADGVRALQEVDERANELDGVEREER